MTSPDGLPIGHYGPGSPSIGDWDFDGLDLVALGDEIIFGPLRKLLSAVTGLPEETWPTIPDIIAGLPGILQGLDLQELLNAIRGYYVGDNLILKGIQDTIAPLRSIVDPITGLIRGVLLPLIPIGKLDDAPVFMLEEGHFSDAPIGGGSGGWFWDGSRGQQAPGSASLAGPARDELISPLVTTISAGTQVTVSAGVASLAASSGVVTIRARWWGSGETRVADTVAGQVTLPAAGWAQVSKQMSVPAGATGVTLHVEADVSAGQVWVDDLMLSKPSGTLPQSWITGLIPDLANVNSWIQDLINAVIRALRGVPIVGGTLADMVAELAGLKRTAEVAEDNAAAARSAVTTVQQIFSVRSSRPLWEGLDPTAESTFPFSQLAQPGSHAHTYSVVVTPGIPVNQQSGFSGVSEHHVTAGRSIGGCIRIESPVEKRQISFIARRDGAVPAFFVDLYRMAPDGSFDLLHSSENIAGELLPQTSWRQIVIPPTLFELGDVALIQFRGAGMTYIRGIQLPVVGNTTSFRPAQIGILRPESTAPAHISRAEADNYYVGETPYIQLGGDVGQLSAPRVYYDNFNRGSLGTSWALKRGAVGGEYLSIKNGRMVNRSSMLLGSQANAVYTLPLNTDRMGVEWDQATVSSRVSGCMINTDNNGNNGCYLYVTDSFATIGKFVNNNTSAAALAAAGNGGTGRYRLEYDNRDNTYRAFKDGVQVGQYTDTAGEFRHGKGNRFVGANIYHNSFTSGGEIDNFYAFDITDEGAPTR